MQDARDGLSRVQEDLAETELTIARLYLLRDQSRGARIHLANTVLAYPTTAGAEEARGELERRGWDLSLHSIDGLFGEAVNQRIERNTR